jgi:outer membrane protein assembly factor BamB
MREFYAIPICLFVSLLARGENVPKRGEVNAPLSMVVMDPLAEPLSCPCVQGYAQRKYEKLADYLTAELGRPVQVTFAESFEKALAKPSCKTIDIAIGKDSVVRSDAAAAKLKVTPVARLSGQDGLTTQTGLIVVRSADPARRIEDLEGYRIIFGPKECDEKFAAARRLLTGAGVNLTSADAAETSQSCSDGACKIIEWGASQRGAAVISSYAAPLLQGCGTVKKGDLRVIGETKPVPFITAFTTNRVDDASRQKIEKALSKVGKQADLLVALETLIGFVEINDDYRALRKGAGASEDSLPATTTKATTKEPASPAAKPAATDSRGANDWPQWRGPLRNGHVESLPNTLPQKPMIVWRQPLRRAGLGGIAATDKFVVLGDRDITNNLDEFRCYRAKDGEPLWTVQYPAVGQLDYDNMPRATPLIYEGKVYLFGAFGDLTCVELDTGVSLWQINVIAQFGGDKELVWGTCSSPLVCDGKLIVNPGGEDASVVALDPNTGDVIWQTPGGRHAYSSFIVATLGGLRQLVGYDQKTLGGWDISTGRRLWTLKPPHDGDFNVPTPVAVDGKLLVATENNFARLYAFRDDGRINPEPVAVSDRLSPDISTPVVVRNRVFCVCDHMYCLDLTKGLRPVWTGEDKSFGNYSPLIASEKRILAFGLGGELLLFDAEADSFHVVSRLRLFDETPSKQTLLLSHPALVNTRLYLRGETELVCADIGPTKR